MKTILLVTTIFITNLLTAQYGVYSPDLWVETDTSGIIHIGDTITFDLNVDEFEPDSCGGDSGFAAFDGLLLYFVGSEKAILYTPTHPPVTYGGLFKTSDSLHDFSMGWGFDQDSNNYAKDDIGHFASGDWDFKFEAKITEPYSRIDAYFYTDYDFFVIPEGCGIAGVPDGPYNIWEYDMAYAGITEEVLKEKKYFDLLGNEIPEPPVNQLYIEQDYKGVRSKKFIVK